MLGTSDQLTSYHSTKLVILVMVGRAVEWRYVNAFNLYTNMLFLHLVKQNCAFLEAVRKSPLRQSLKRNPKLPLAHLNSITCVNATDSEEENIVIQ